MIESRTIASRDEWLEWRKADVTASSVAAMFGLHPYMTLAQLVAEKRGIGTGPDPESSVIRRGNKLEPVCARMVGERHPDWSLQKSDQYFRDTELRLAATPDYIIVAPEHPTPGVLQCKTVGASVFKRTWEDGQPPFWISLQIATEMHLTKCTWGVIGALIVGEYQFELVEVRVDAHRGAIKRIEDAAKEFWRSFESGEEPTIDYERDNQLLSLLYPHEVPGKLVDLSTDNSIRDLLDRREALRESLTALEKRVKAVDTEIKAKMGDAERGICDGWSITLKTVNRDAYTVQPTSYRQLRTKRTTPERSDIDG